MNKNEPIRPLGKYLIGFIAGILALCFVFAPAPCPVDLSTVQFTTTSSSRLYFHNVRSYYYRSETDPASRFGLYRLKRALKDTSTQALPYVIVLNPLQDEAYIYTERQISGKQYSPGTVLINTTVWSLENLNNEKYFVLAAALYNALLEDQPVLFKQSGDAKATPMSSTQRFYTEILLEDYFKLIGKI